MEIQQGVTPLDEARVYQTSINRGRTVHILSQETKVHPWKIVMRLGLLKLAPEIQSAVNAGSVSTGEAYEISRIGYPEAQMEVFAMVAAKQLRGQNQVRLFVNELLGAGSGKKGRRQGAMNWTL
jgi:hypothetical protein